MKKKKQPQNIHRSDMANLTEEFEIKHIVKTLGVPSSMVKQAIKHVGNNREKIEEYLRGKT